MISPLILDPVAAVRATLLTLFSSLPASSLAPHSSRILLYVHSAMTHISPDIRSDSTKFLSFLTKILPEEVVRSSWVRSIDCFFALLGWERDKPGAIKTSLFGASRRKTLSQHLEALHVFLSAGLAADTSSRSEAVGFHLDTIKHMIPTNSSPYAHLSLFTIASEQSLNSADDATSRMALLGPYVPGLKKGLDDLRKEGGEVGRAVSKITDLLEVDPE